MPGSNITGSDKPGSNKKGLFFGISTIDSIYLVDNPPQRNEKISAHQQLLCTGGPSSNAAITFSALGGKATLASGLGSHPITSIVHNELKNYKINHIDLCPTDQSVPTMSSIYITKYNGDRSVVSVNAQHMPSKDFRVGDLDLTGYKTALFDGQYMALAIELAKACQKAGIHTILDGGSWKPGTEDLIQYTDSAICSSAFKPPAIRSSDDTLKWLSDQNVARAAITRGEQPILAMENGNRFEALPPTPPAVRDTLAAGDIFHGAYAYFYADSTTDHFAHLLEKSAKIAAQACMHFGPRKWADHFQLG